MKNLISIIGFVLLYNVGLFALKPDTNYVITPTYYHVKYREIKILTCDSIKLNTWIYQPDSAIDRRITVIIAGGDAGNMSYSIIYASYLQSKGFRVICFDYRGFGHSSPFMINRANLYYDEFSTDLLTVCNYAKEKYPENLTGVLGLSMGTIIAFSLCELFPLDFIIAEGAVIDAKEVAARLQRSKNNDVVCPPSAGKIKDIIMKSSVPILFICGLKDEVSKIDDCENLLSGKNDREIVIFNGAHLQGMPILQTRYFSYIEGFVEGLPIKNGDL